MRQIHNTHQHKTKPSENTTYYMRGKNTRIKNAISKGLNFNTKKINVENAHKN